MLKRFFSIIILCAVLAPAIIGCGTATPPEDTDMTSETVTDAPTDPITTTEPATEPPTEPVTEPVTEAPTGPITVVCVGDSITEGVGVTNRSVDSYPAQLQKLLGDGYKVVNCGKSKATALDTSSKYHNTNGIPYRTTTQYTAGLRAEPDVVLIMLGTNDAKHVTGSIEQSVNDYYDALKAIGEKFAALESKPKIYIVASPYRYEDSVRKANMDSAIIPTQKKLADDMGWGYIDLFTPTKDAVSQNIHSDKLHFNKNGYALISEIIKNEITK